MLHVITIPHTDPRRTLFASEHVVECPLVFAHLSDDFGFRLRLNHNSLVAKFVTTDEPNLLCKTHSKLLRCRKGTKAPGLITELYATNSNDLKLARAQHLRQHLVPGHEVRRFIESPHLRLFVVHQHSPLRFPLCTHVSLLSEALQ